MDYTRLKMNVNRYEEVLRGLGPGSDPKPRNDGAATFRGTKKAPGLVGPAPLYT